MSYTVKKLAKLSGVSVRTLHFYDAIGLLKPAYYGENNYRYYEEKELLLLQQILFFRELGFALTDIKRIIESPDFDKVKALESHRMVLEQKIKSTYQLLETVDKTISYLRGKTTMKLEEVFAGFDAEKQKLYENFLVEQGISEKEITKTKEKVNQWDKKRWMLYKQEGDQLHAELVEAIKQQLSPSSAEVQLLIKKHYQMITAFWVPTRESYIGLSQLYGSHPDFVKFYENIHPQLLSFLTAAMKLFADKELT